MDEFYKTDNSNVVNLNSKKYKKNDFNEYESEYSYNTTLLLCYFFGAFGIHRFYTNKIGTGVLMFLTGGMCGIWTIIDLIIILTGNFKDSEEIKIGSDKPFFKNWANIYVIVMTITGLTLYIKLIILV